MRTACVCTQVPSCATVPSNDQSHRAAPALVGVDHRTPVKHSILYVILFIIKHIHVYDMNIICLLPALPLSLLLSLYVYANRYLYTSLNFIVNIKLTYNHDKYRFSYYIYNIYIHIYILSLYSMIYSYTLLIHHIYRIYTLHSVYIYACTYVYIRIDIHVP